MNFWVFHKFLKIRQGVRYKTKRPDICIEWFRSQIKGPLNCKNKVKI